jgi:PTH1 family peptidyl-tRNA hydrolase
MSGFIRRFFSRAAAVSSRSKVLESMAEARLIVGLGNPGTGYVGTRHNVGFDVIDAFCKRYGIEIRKKKFGGLFGEAVIGDMKILLLKPQEYMNLSGQAVATAAGFYRLPVENLIVVTDDMALEPGKIRIRQKGSAGGHNGLSNIKARLGTDEYARLRVGIGRSERIIARDYVLGRPSAGEREQIDKAVTRSIEALDCWVNEGVDRAMNKFNVNTNE